MADLGSLVVKLSAETSEFREDLGRTARLLDRHAGDMKASMQQVASVAKTAFAVVIGTTSVAALRDFVTHTLEAAAALQGLSEQTGASAAALSGFAPVATISGTAMEAIGASLTKLSKGLAGVDDETAGATKALQFLGVRAKDAGGNLRDPAEVMNDVALSRQQAYREGLYQAASNRYRRRLVKFTTEMEGFIPAFGDLIAIQHDMPAWGQFAECTAWNSASRTLTVSEPLTWSIANHYIGFRTKAGGVDGPYAVSRGASDNEMVLTTHPVTVPYTGQDYERTHIAFGWSDTWRQLAKVIAVRPRGLHQVEIEAINEDPSVHSADQGVTAPAVVTSQLTTLYTTPLIADLTLRSSTTDNSKALLTWTPAPGAESYQIEMAAGSNPRENTQSALHNQSEPNSNP